MYFLPNFRHDKRTMPHLSLNVKRAATIDRGLRPRDCSITGIHSWVGTNLSLDKTYRWLHINTTTNISDRASYIMEVKHGKSGQEQRTEYAISRTVPQNLGGVP